MSYYNALNFVKNYRVVRPNLGFGKQLEDYEKKLKESLKEN